MRPRWTLQEIYSIRRNVRRYSRLFDKPMKEKLAEQRRITERRLADRRQGTVTP